MAVGSLLGPLAGCENRTSASIAAQFEASGRKSIDLASVVPGQWDRVCIIGPYATDELISNIIGFKWSTRMRSGIGGDDQIALLLFIHDREVEQYIEHPRGSGDFVGAVGCHKKENAKFINVPVSPEWQQLRPTNDA
jgi:hypothetical protein